MQVRLSDYRAYGRRALGMPIFSAFGTQTIIPGLKTMDDTQAGYLLSGIPVGKMHDGSNGIQNGGAALPKIPPDVITSVSNMLSSDWADDNPPGSNAMITQFVTQANNLLAEMNAHWPSFDNVNIIANFDSSAQQDAQFRQERNDFVALCQKTVASWNALNAATPAGPPGPKSSPAAAAAAAAAVGGPAPSTSHTWLWVGLGVGALLLGGTTFFLVRRSHRKVKRR